MGFEIKEYGESKFFKYQTVARHECFKCQNRWWWDKEEKWVCTLCKAVEIKTIWDKEEFNRRNSKVNYFNNDDD